MTGKERILVLATHGAHPRPARGPNRLCFVDPRDPIRPVSLERVRDLLAGRMALAGGVSALSLASGHPARIEEEVRRAAAVLGAAGRFILHPVDALFPDTPWAGVESLIESWKKYRNLKQGE
jgi:uroporphyrinogen-III decarboxylase